jgi:hypothetical protein
VFFFLFLDGIIIRHHANKTMNNDILFCEHKKMKKTAILDYEWTTSNLNISISLAKLLNNINSQDYKAVLYSLGELNYILCLNNPFLILKQVLDDNFHPQNFSKEIENLLCYLQLLKKSLIKLLNYPDDQIVSRTLDVIERLREKEFIPHLWEIIVEGEKKSIQLRGKAIETLKRIRFLEANQLLVKLLFDKNEKIIAKALFELEKMLYTLELYDMYNNKNVVNMFKILIDSPHCGQKIKNFAGRIIEGAEKENFYKKYPNVINYNYTTNLREFFQAFLTKDSEIIVPIVRGYTIPSEIKPWFLQLISNEKYPEFIRETIAEQDYSILQMFYSGEYNPFPSIEKAIKLRNHKIQKSSERMLKEISDAFVMREKDGIPESEENKNILAKLYSLLEEIVDKTPETLHPFNTLIEKHKKQGDFESAIYFSKKKIEHIRQKRIDNMNDKAEEELACLNKWEEIGTAMKNKTNLWTLINIEQRKMQAFFNIGIKWQKICNEIAKKFYGKVLLDTENETTLINNAKPDIIIDNDSVRRNATGKISYADFIIDSKIAFEIHKTYGTITNIDKELTKYVPFCQKLYIWHLQGDTIPNEIINIHLQDKNHFKDTNNVESLSSNTLISKLENIGEKELVIQAKDLKNQLTLLYKNAELEILKQIKKELLYEGSFTKYIKSENSKYSQIRTIIEEAKEKNGTLCILYKNSQGEITTREIKPLSISQKLFDAYCYLEKANRTFRIDRIVKIIPKSKKHEDQNVN